MIIQRYVDVYTGMFDFAVSGGAIGSYDLQVPIVLNSLVEFCVLPVIGAAGGAGCTISFDTINTNLFPITTNVGALIAAQGFAAYGGVSTPIFGRYWGGAGANAPQLQPNPSSVGMSIAGNTLTAGKFKVIVRVIGFDF